MADDIESDHPDGQSEGGPVKTFLDHLEDLRWVMIKSIVALAVGMILCLIAGNHVVGILKWPLERAPSPFPGTNQVLTVSYGTNQLGTFQLSAAEAENLALGTNRFVSVAVEPQTIGTNRVLGWRVTNRVSSAKEAHRMQVELVNLSPAGGFIVAFQVAIYAGAVLAAPFIFYFVMSFVFPALKIKEKKYIGRGLAFGGGLFFLGVAFCYFVLMPVALAASQKYSNWLGFGATQWRAEDYISFVCKFMVGMGLGFELPVVLLTLVKIGVLSYKSLRAMWRYMVVIVLVLGGFLTTPEVITQVMMALPLYVLYEISVWIAWYWEWRDRKRATQDPISS